MQIHSSVCQQLAQNLPGPSNKRGYLTQTGPGIYTIPVQSSKGDEYGAREGLPALQGGTRSCGKRGCNSLRRQWRWFLQPTLPCNKVTGCIVTGYQPQRARPTLQNGLSEIAKRSYSERGLATEVRSQAAYLSVRIHKDHQKYLRFHLANRAWQFRALTFRLSSTPQTCTKLMKAVVCTLRRLGICLIFYQDNMSKMAQCRKEINSHQATTMELLCALSFIINMKKRVFCSSRSIDLLGFTLDTSTNTLDTSTSLPQQKLTSLHKLARQLIKQEKVTAWTLAKLLGMMVAAYPAILPATLHYRTLERAKRRAVWDSADYESAVRPLQILTIELNISLKGWGTLSQGRSTGIPRTVEERKQHIKRFWL